MNDLVEWYLTALRKFAQFTGRSRRREFWSFTLVNFGVSIVLSMLGRIVGANFLGTIIGLIATVYSLVVLVPGIAVAVRRMHDTGRSGWWLLINFIPIVGWIVYIFFAVQDSEPGENQYGPNPKGAFA